MGVFNRPLEVLRDWTERDDGTLEGPALSTNSLDIKSEPSHIGIEDHVVPISEGLGVSDAIPVSNTTPIQDAIDLINSSGDGGGTILLPNGFFRHSGPITDFDHIEIRGQGRRETTVAFDHGGDAIDISANSDAENAMLSRFEIYGDGDTSGGRGMVISGVPQRFHLDRVNFARWDNANKPVIEVTGKPFQCNWLDVKLRSYQGNGIKFDDIGTNNWWGQMTIKAPGGYTPVNFNRTGGELTIEQLNVSQDADRIGNIRTAGSGVIQVKNIHFEGSQPNGVKGNAIFAGGDGDMEIANTRIQSGSFDYIYNTTGAATDGQFVFQRSTGNAPNNQVLRVSDDISNPAQYWGVASEVDNATGAVLSNPVWCEGDGVYKKSTGTGYDGGTDDRKV